MQRQLCLELGDPPPHEVFFRNGEMASCDSEVLIEDFFAYTEYRGGTANLELSE
jgi:hypothetical protein